MKKTVGCLALFFICLAMFTSESAIYIPGTFIAIGLTLLWIERRMR